MDETGDNHIKRIKPAMGRKAQLVSLAVPRSSYSYMKYVLYKMKKKVEMKQAIERHYFRSLLKYMCAHIHICTHSVHIQTCIYMHMYIHTYMYTYMTHGVFGAPCKTQSLTKISLPRHGKSSFELKVGRIQESPKIVFLNPLGVK